MRIKPSASEEPRSTATKVHTSVLPTMAELKSPPFVAIDSESSVDPQTNVS